MTDLVNTSDLTIEERLALLEAKLTPSPQAVVPPITIGSLANVPAPGSQIAAQWAQDASTDVIHRFPTYAALSAWAAPDGCRAVQTDNGREWRRIAAGWSLVTPWTGTGVGVALHGVQSGVASTVQIPADPYTRIATMSAHLQVAVFAGNTCAVGILFDGTQVAESIIPKTAVQIAPDGANLIWNVSMTAQAVVPTGRPIQITVAIVVDVPGLGTYETFAGPAKNRVDVLVTPRSF